MGNDNHYQNIIDLLKQMFPEAECELLHKNVFELLIAVILSAQTTDAGVNKVTPNLFELYPTPIALANAKVDDVERCIAKIGLYKTKASNIVRCAEMIVNQFDGEVPSAMKDLIQLPGCGRKTASVVRSVWFDIPSVPVDTHVDRICKRLGIAKQQDDVLGVERKFKRKIKREEWNKVHHLFIFFGRYFCTARNPKCMECPLTVQCKYYKKVVRLSS